MSPSQDLLHCINSLYLFSNHVGQQTKEPFPPSGQEIRLWVYATFMHISEVMKGQSADQRNSLYFLDPCHVSKHTDGYTNTAGRAPSGILLRDRSFGLV